jgi:hypothetical protein
LINCIDYSCQYKVKSVKMYAVLVLLDLLFHLFKEVGLKTER